MPVHRSFGAPSIVTLILTLDEKFTVAFSGENRFELPVLFVTPVVIAFVTYNHYRRLLNFVNQMRLSLILMLTFSILFYLAMMDIFSTNHPGWKVVKYTLVGAQLAFTILYVVGESLSSDFDSTIRVQLHHDRDRQLLVRLLHKFRS